MYPFIFGLIDSSIVATDTSEVWSDGVSIFRLQVRTSGLYLDQTITVTGFDGAEEVDWDNIWDKRY